MIEACPDPPGPPPPTDPQPGDVPWIARMFGALGGSQ
jgi:hypothetical protein